MSGESLDLEWRYHKGMFRRETIEKITELYLSELLSLIDDYLQTS